jgi:hypothetical protein
MTDWNTGEWLHMGLADVEPLPNGSLMRRPFLPYIQMLHHWQEQLKRVTRLDEDPFDSAVALDEVREAAQRLQTRPDRNWH